MRQRKLLQQFGSISLSFISTVRFSSFYLIIIHLLRGCTHCAAWFLNSLFHDRHIFGEISQFCNYFWSVIHRFWYFPRWMLCSLTKSIFNSNTNLTKDYIGRGISNVWAIRDLATRQRKKLGAYLNRKKKNRFSWWPNFDTPILAF